MEQMMVSYVVHSPVGAVNEHGYSNLFHLRARVQEQQSIRVVLVGFGCQCQTSIRLGGGVLTATHRFRCTCVPQDNVR